MSCPPADQLLGFASGQLTDDQSARVEAHIDGCGECRGVLSNLARGDAPPSFGRYRIDTVLGSGGMGIVYRGYDPQLARPLAIKVLRRAADDDVGRARLIREAQSLAKVSHPNVCHVYDVGSEGEEVWVAMELIDGVSLRQWADERRPQAELLAALLGAAEGIAAAHNAGIVHRDVKPENVLVTREGRAIVTDFGLARPQDLIDPVASTISNDPHLTATGAIAGTPAYLAPEQLTGDTLDARVDQFAWAVMAWELLTTVKPFPIAFVARLEAIRAGVQTPPSSLSRPVAAALTKALSLAPRDRFPSMRELIEAIKQTPAEAPAATKRSNRTAAIASVVALAGIGVGTAAWIGRGDHAETSAAPIPAPAPQTAQQSTPPQPAPTPVVATPSPPQPATTPPATPPTTPPTTPVTAVATTPSTPAKSAPPKTAKLVNAPTPAPAPARMHSSSFQRGNAIEVIDTFCHVPYDFSRPDLATGQPMADWGKVTKVETELGRLGDRTVELLVIEVAGQRGTYRFDDDFGPLGDLVVAPGDRVALCVEDDVNTYQLPGGSLNATHTAFPITREPRITELAALKPLHVSHTALLASASARRLIGIDPDRRYLVRAKVESKEDDLFSMGAWFIEVPKSIRGAAMVSPGKQLWFVIEKPVFEDLADGKQRLVVTAAAVLDDLFP